MGGFRSSLRRAWRSKGRIAAGAGALLLFAAAVAGCSRGEPDRAAPPSPARVAIDAAAGATSAESVTVPAGVPDAATSDAGAGDPKTGYETANPISGKSVGHTSVVFKLGLEGGLPVAYKPRSTRGDHRYRGEIAAYRLARALSLENVPLALPRSFDFAPLQAAVGSEKIFAEVVKEPDETVRGALMPWIKGLEFIPLESAEWMPKWKAWLGADGAIPADQRDLAAQISDLLAFDLVTGNWDRWSGGNIAIDRARGLLLYVDNDGAFFDPVPVKEMKRPAALFEGVDRFSRRFVAALRTVDVATAVGEERPGEPLLSPRLVAQCDARRKRVLAVVDAKIAKRGEASVLAFE
jgi:hypothetical protein